MSTRNRTYSTSPRQLGFFCALFLLLFAGGATEQASAQFFLACDSVSITPKFTEENCCWEFILNNNQSGTWFSDIKATVLTPTASITGATGPYGASQKPTSVNWNFPNNLPTGSTRGLVACFDKGTANAVTLLFTWNYLGQEICRDTVVINCPTILPTGCLSLEQKMITCKEAPNGTEYEWCFVIRNESGTPADHVTLNLPQGTSASPSAITFSPALMPGQVSLRQCVRISGAGLAGATIPIGYKLCNKAQDSCCNGETSITLTDCGPKECLNIREDSIRCTLLESNQQGYAYTFSVRNLGVAPSAATLKISSPGISVSPNTITLGGLLPNAWATGIRVRLGSGASTGPHTLYFTLCDSTGQICCTDSVLVELPECNKPKECRDCCRKFPKDFPRVTGWASGSGFTAIEGILQAGATKICSVSATIVEAQVNGQAVAAEFIPVSALAGVPGTSLYGNEVRWSGIDVNTPTNFSLQIKLPPIQWPSFIDRVKYCVRFQFTDLNCVTCDTVLCFEQTRYRWFFFSDPLGGFFTGNEQKAGERIQSSAADQIFSGALHGQDSGTLAITFPQIPPQLGAAHYAGLRIEPTEGISLVAVTSGSAGYPFSIVNGTARSAFTVDAGITVELGLKYDDLGNRAALEHFVSVRFVLDSAPNDTLEESALVTLRKIVLLEGGDKLEPAQPEVREVRTYALRLANANKSEEPIRTLVLETEEGVAIAAVGPTATENRARLQFGETTDGTTTRRYTGEYIGDLGVTLNAGQELAPVYLTLAGIVDEITTIHFTTLNANGAVISEGDLTLSSPASAVHNPGNTHGGNAELLRGNYPNPANTGTTIQFTLPYTERAVTLTVTDEMGRQIARLIDNETIRAGTHAVYVDTGSMPSGIYFYTLQTETTTETQRMQVVR